MGRLGYRQIGSGGIGKDCGRFFSGFLDSIGYNLAITDLIFRRGLDDNSIFPELHIYIVGMPNDATALIR